MTRTIKLLLLALALGLGIVSSLVVYTLRQGREEAFIATDIAGVQWARDFNLVDHNGRRGTPDEITDVTKAFKIYFRSDAPAANSHAAHGSESASYMVDHSTGILVFDRDGRARLYVGAHGRSVDAMVHDVELLLKS